MTLCSGVYQVPSWCPIAAHNKPRSHPRPQAVPEGRIKNSAQILMLPCDLRLAAATHASAISSTETRTRIPVTCTARTESDEGASLQNRPTYARTRGAPRHQPTTTKTG
jgi:hypothetical protein